MARFTLGVLSSSIHIVWALAAGGRLEDRPVYAKSTCFEPFPFPDPDEATRERIRELGERLDAHRKRQQSLHPDLTLTALYNVLEALRSGRPLTDKERAIHDQLDTAAPASAETKLRWPAELPAQVAVLRQLLSDPRAPRDPAGLSARFGRKSAKREKQIAEILQTMEAMGA